MFLVSVRARISIYRRCYVGMDVARVLQAKFPQPQENIFQTFVGYLHTVLTCLNPRSTLIQC